MVDCIEVSRVISTSETCVVSLAGQIHVEVIL
jgi:hypothetical protein